MELIAITGAGVVAYCGWLAVMDEIGSYRRCRGASGKRREKVGSERPAGYSCCLLTVLASRQ